MVVCTEPAPHSFCQLQCAELGVGDCAGEVVTNDLIYIIQVQLVQFLRLLLDHYRNRGQVMVTVLTHLWQYGRRFISVNLLRLLLPVAHVRRES